MAKTAVLIDGGHVRSQAQRAGRPYDPSLIANIALACRVEGENIQRVLYYDCAPYTGQVRLPVSGETFQFTGSDAWLHELARKDLFAVRRGVLKFRGWIPRRTPIHLGQTILTDGDFKPDFEQKGVDMRIGLDMANYAATRAVDLLVLMTNDTDCIPAMKYARRAGLQVALAHLPTGRTAPELLAHCDYERVVDWP